MRDVGVLGVYTDQISNESQKKVKPILEELYKAICGMRLTKNEAKWLAFFIHSRISDANRESEKYELFNPVEVKDGVQMAEMCMRVDDVVYTSGITEVKVKISIDDSEMNKFIKKLKKAIKLGKELQAIQSNMESSDSIGFDGHSIAKAVLKANRDRKNESYTDNKKKKEI